MKINSTNSSLFSLVFACLLWSNCSVAIVVSVCVVGHWARSKGAGGGGEDTF